MLIPGDISAWYSGSHRSDVDLRLHPDTVSTSSDACPHVRSTRGTASIVQLSHVQERKQPIILLSDLHGRHTLLARVESSWLPRSDPFGRGAARCIEGPAQALAPEKV